MEGLFKQFGAVEACSAHNREDDGSKPSTAICGRPPNLLYLKAMDMLYHTAKKTATKLFI